MAGKHSMTSLAPEMHIGHAPLSSILACRTRVLRPHFAAGQLAHFDGDDAPDTWHGALWAHGEVMGCVTMMHRQSERIAQPPRAWRLARDRVWQLRGMAIDARYRGRGYGAHVLEYVCESTDAHTLIWCNARKAAINLYARAGFEIVGNEFEVPLVGPHVVMGLLR